jgi:hypothetical protein
MELPYPDVFSHYSNFNKSKINFCQVLPECAGKQESQTLEAYSKFKICFKMLTSFRICYLRFLSPLLRRGLRGFYRVRLHSHQFHAEIGKGDENQTFKNEIQDYYSNAFLRTDLGKISDTQSQG